MKKSRNIQADIQGLNRERFSNFVVDLRAAEKKKVAVAKKEVAVVKKEVRAEIKRDWKYLKRRGNKLKGQAAGNLLKIETAAKRLMPDLSLSKRKNYCFKKIAGLFRSLFDGSRCRRFNSGRRHWFKELQAREAEFDNHLHFRSLRRRALSAAGENGFRYPHSGLRSAWYFAIVLIIIILPFKILSSLDIWNFRSFEGRIMSHSQLAVSSLMAAADSVSRLDLKDAGSDFRVASANFLEAQDDLSQINDAILALAALSGNEKIKLAAEGKKFLAAGVYASSLGSHLISATDSLFNPVQENFGGSLDNFLLEGGLAAADAKSLRQVLDKINTDSLPVEYRQKFISLSKQTAVLADNLDNFIAIGSKVKEILGLSRDKRYLVVFQNNAELRASGGFIGSYALVDVRNGHIRNLEVPGGGSYDTEGGMKVRVAAPQPLWLVNPLWHFWDANWWPDWPTTAQNLAWFYEKSGGPSVDGVIGVTPTVMEGLLDITGPIDLTAEYGLVIDKDNFWEVVQKVTEHDNLVQTHPGDVLNLPATSTVVSTALPLKQDLDSNVDNKPKKIIGDLLAKILEVLPQKLNRENFVKIAAVLEKSLAEKQVLFYFNDPVLQQEFSSRNWTGEIQPADYDYLMVVDTNIAGQKSDRLMSEKIDWHSDIQSDGSIINTVEITRTHNGLNHEALTGVRNVDWMRVYVPGGSEFIDAYGFVSPDAKYLQERPDPEWQQLGVLAAEMSAETDSASQTRIYSENGKTVFANWLMVDPGQSLTVTIRYRLPFNALNSEPVHGWLERLKEYVNAEAPRLKPYSFLIQKQAGAQPSEFTGHLSLPDNLKVFWNSAGEDDGHDSLETAVRLNSDKYYSWLLEEKNN